MQPTTLPMSIYDDPRWSRYIPRKNFTMTVIRRVSVGSAAKLLAVLNALIFAVFGGFMVILTILGSMVGVAGGGSDVLGAAGVGIIGTVIFYLVGIVGMLIAGAIGGAIYAFVYNIVASITGGIEVELGQR
jgi:hypothetical protein